jgi:uncharacterized membrane-anchored protein
MQTSTEKTLAKVPEITLGFWLIKIAATTLGVQNSAVGQNTHSWYRQSISIK